MKINLVYYRMEGASNLLRIRCGRWTFVLLLEALSCNFFMIVSFLWHGTIRIHTGARVGWMDICFPKSEGGLGIRKIVSWSETCILKASSYVCSTSKLAQFWFAWMKKIYNVSSFWRKQKCLSQMYGYGLDLRWAFYWNESKSGLNSFGFGLEIKAFMSSGKLFIKLVSYMLAIKMKTNTKLTIKGNSVTYIKSTIFCFV